MSDFEERVRRGLRSDLGAVDPESVLADVTRGVVRRRRRRASLAVAATVLVVGGVVGTVAVLNDDGRERANPILPAPTPTQPVLPPGAIQGVIDVSAASEVFRLTTNVGCAACSTVWRHDASSDGGWKRLHDFGAEAFVGPASALDGPMTQLVMADDDNGWAWGQKLYSTHDGGDTWTEVTHGPGRLISEYGPQVRFTDPYAWALLRTDQGAELWRSSPHSDMWTRADAPNMSGVSSIVTIGRNVALETADEGLSSLRLQYSKDGTAWGEVAKPCPGNNRIYPSGGLAFLLCAGHGKTTIYLVNGEEHGQLDLDTWEVYGTFPAETVAAAVPLSNLTLLVIGEDRAATLMTSEGTRTVDLGLEPDEEAFSVMSPNADLIVTSSDRLLKSDDQGLTWYPLE